MARRPCSRAALRRGLQQRLHHSGASRWLRRNCCRRGPRKQVTAPVWIMLDARKIHCMRAQRPRWSTERRSPAPPAFNSPPWDAAANGAPPPSGSAPGYKQPPPEILQIVDAPPQPGLSFSPDRKLILQLARPPSLPPLSEISRPELRLAGAGGACGDRSSGSVAATRSPAACSKCSLRGERHSPVRRPPTPSSPNHPGSGIRIDAAQFSRSRMSYNVGLSIVPADEVVPSAAAREVTGYPPGSCINYVRGAGGAAPRADAGRKYGCAPAAHHLSTRSPAAGQPYPQQDSRASRAAAGNAWGRAAATPRASLAPPCAHRRSHGRPTAGTSRSRRAAPAAQATRHAARCSCGS